MAFRIPSTRFTGPLASLPGSPKMVPGDACWSWRLGQWDEWGEKCVCVCVGGDLPALLGMREPSRWSAMEIGPGNWIWRRGEQGDRRGKRLEEIIFLHLFFYF